MIADWSGMQCCQEWLFTAKVATFETLWRDEKLEKPPPPLLKNVAIFDIWATILKILLNKQLFVS